MRTFFSGEALSLGALSTDGLLNPDVRENIVLCANPFSLDQLITYPLKALVIADHVVDQNLLMVFILAWDNLVKELKARPLSDENISRLELACYSLRPNQVHFILDPDYWNVDLFGLEDLSHPGL